ncbi:MAG TPA: CPBP family intramembrane glutamic endopeptidase [Candidatus Acidoferrum sp.]|jgi:membrane protease YdiL (CAAX protease family)|nr:CPBP family intramembrane glutamic endopeptidase [Candidatus Acidoferrum sp.]
MSLTVHRPWLVALITLVVLVVTTYTHNLLALLPAYRQLHRTAPFYYAESIDRIVVIALCALTVWLMRRAGLRDVIRELGLSAPILPAFAFALCVSLPMLIGFALTRSITPHPQLLPILYLSVFSPFVEELDSRGFGVRQFQRGTGWPFWVAVWPSVVLSGWSHVDKSENLLEGAGLFFLTGSGGLLFAWLVYRWQNLWVPIALHICMNLWWELFSVSRTAIGGWFPVALQSLTVLLAILVTLYYRRSKASPQL